MFSKACECGILAVTHILLRSQKGEKSSLNCISGALKVPVDFTDRILQLLVRSEILLETKGENEGYEIEKEKISTITVSNIVDAIDGFGVYKKCVIGFKNCDNRKPCPFHNRIVEIRSSLEHRLRTTTIEKLANEFEHDLAALRW